MLVYTNIQHKFRKENNLSCLEYVLLDMVYKLATNPDSKVKGWCYSKREYMAGEIGVSKQGLLKMIDRLIKSGFLIKDEVTRFLKTTEKWNETYFTDGKQSLPESSEKSKQSLPEHGKQSLPNNNSINNYNLIDNIDSTPTGEPAKNFKQWTLEDFGQEIKKYSEKVNRDDLTNFYNHWREKDAKGKMKLQNEKTWETNLRLNKWLKNKEIFEKPKYEKTGGGKNRTAL
jgi:hypothetical protein